MLTLIRLLLRSSLIWVYTFAQAYLFESLGSLWYHAMLKNYMPNVPIYLKSIKLRSAIHFIQSLIEAKWILCVPNKLSQKLLSSKGHNTNLDWGVCLLETLIYLFLQNWSATLWRLKVIHFDQLSMSTFGVLPMVPLIILPWVAIGTTGDQRTQWYHW